ncbi:MAG: helix-turn-helix transcriptional regulator [Smithella sp.]
MYNYKQLGKARKELNMSIADVVLAFYEHGKRITGQTVLNHEAGISKPDADILALYALIYDKPVSYFFDLKRHNACHVLKGANKNKTAKIECGDLSS